MEPDNVTKTTGLLQMDHVTKEYVKGKKVNDDISLSVDGGEIFGLLGPNGAGKTTLVSQTIGLVRPSSGMIRIDGVDVVADPGYARKVCSFQAQTQVPIAGLTARQAIDLVGRIRGGDATTVKRRTDELIERLEIGEWANKSAETFSGGVRRLVAFCMAVVNPGRIVILDEPTNDVDPLRRRLLWRQVRALSEKGSAVILVTHNVLEAERAVDRLAIIDQGKVVGMGTPASLKEQDRQNMRLELILELGMEMPPLPAFVAEPFASGRRVMVRLDEGSVAPAMEWARDLKQKEIVEEFSIGPTTLEDAYIRMVGRLDALEAGEAAGR